MEPTILKGIDGIEYVIDGGKLREKCHHRTVRDESVGSMRKEVCHDCGKVLIFNPDTTRDTFRDFQESFNSMHGRYPRGEELSAYLF